MADRTVDTRYYPAKVTVPANTPQDAPYSQELLVEDLPLVQLELLIPSGHVGLTGFALEQDGVRVIPWGDQSSWIVGEDEQLTFVGGFDVHPGILAVGYNVSPFDHSFYVRLTLKDRPTIVPQLFRPMILSAATPYPSLS